jgi:hypothetical protein
MHNKTQFSAGIAVIAAMLACNMPSKQQINVAVTAFLLAQTGTAVALTAQSQAGVPSAPPAPASAPPVPPSAVPPPTLPPTACSAFVTTTTNANVRTGPSSTDYPDPVGVIPTGGTAPLLGRNDANTWWYIAFAAGPGGHAWIAQSVTTAACLPAVVPVIAAPPVPPTATPVPAVFAVIHVTYNLSTVTQGSYHDCPVVTAHITSNAAGTVTYHWTRSDGASAPVQTLVFGSAGTQDVHESWFLGSVWAGTTNWLGIYIDSPNHQDFGHKQFTIACSSP